MDYLSHVLRKTSDHETTTIDRLLNKQLADTIDLRSQARQSYFNVRGPYSEELRSLFDGLARDLRQFADLIAEHIKQVGGYAVATVRSVANESGLRDSRWMLSIPVTSWKLCFLAIRDMNWIHSKT